MLLTKEVSYQEEAHNDYKTQEVEEVKHHYTTQEVGRKQDVVY